MFDWQRYNYEYYGSMKNSKDDNKKEDSKENEPKSTT